MKVSAIVADDEAPGRRGLCARLARRAAFEVVAECGSGPETIAAVKRHVADALFLDVGMPGLDGFEVAEALPGDRRPFIVFVTAHAERAARAFRVQALDYLVKPIDDEEFAATLERLLEAVRARAARRPPKPFAVRERGTIGLVAPGELDWIQAEGDYVRLHAGGRSWLLRETLGAIERRLPEGFLRIHRSAIVNAERIEEVRPFSNGDSDVRLRGGASVRASRTRRGALARLFRRG